MRLDSAHRQLQYRGYILYLAVFYIIECYCGPLGGVELLHSTVYIHLCVTVRGCRSLGYAIAAFCCLVAAQIVLKYVVGYAVEPSENLGL